MILTELRPRRSLVLALSLAGALLAWAGPALAQDTPSSEEKVDLAAQMTVGDEQSYTFRTETKQSMTVGAAEPQMQGSEVESLLRTRVREVDAEGVATVQFVYERMKVKVGSPNGNFDFDSEWPIARDAGNPIAPAVRHLVGKSITARIDSKGQLLDMQSIDTTGADPNVARMLADLINPDSFRQLVVLLYGLKSDPSTANVGEMWSSQSALPSGMGSMQITREFTLESVIAGKAYVNIGGGIDLVIDPNLPKQPGAEFLEWKGGKVEGRVVWDARNGRLDKVEVGTEINAADSNPAYQGNVLTVSITSKSALTRRI